MGRKTGGKKGLTENQLRAVLEHRVSYEAEQISAVLPYADEVVESSYDYAPEYRVRIVAEQVERLAVEFPNLDFSHVEELASGKLPEGAEGWGVIPKQSKVAKSCHGAMDKAIDLLSAQHGKKFKNWRVGALTEKYLRLLEKTEKTLAKLEAETPGDYLVIPFQFGKKWRGKSVRHAQARFAEDEFGLGPYEVAILLLTHPDRITGSNQLNIDCGGCEYRTDVSESAFPFCLDFSWYYDCKRMVLNRFGADYAFELWGSASGFASLCLYFRAKALNKQSFCDII
ncbi:hypothetical protein HQ571_06070 [Candidatus Kuenenbacteria bacterium]|nr:hypothetical protein [Candidatus Kuenenbacteria bacterium]